jgi:hypothetical protein
MERNAIMQEEEPTTPFKAAPFKAHVVRKLKPGLLSFMLDSRCPEDVLFKIYLSLTPYAALKLADLFPDTFKTFFRERVLPKCKISDHWSDEKMRQWIEEDEIGRLSPVGYISDRFGHHRHAGNFDPAEYEVIRDH